jgi:nicotinate-nucleotide adenylyltransferase
LCEFAGLDEVWFVVSPLNPLKDEADLLDNDLRLEMVSLAIGNYPNSKLPILSSHFPPELYGSNLRLLKDQFPDREFHLIIGADNWRQFHLWKSMKRL